PDRVAPLDASGAIVQDEGSGPEPRHPYAEALHFAVVVDHLISFARRRLSRPYETVGELLLLGHWPPSCPHLVRAPSACGCPIAYLKLRWMSTNVLQFCGIVRWAKAARCLCPLTLNQRVAGSSPAAPTTLFHDLQSSAAE